MKIVCLTGEIVDILVRLGCESHIVGVTGYAKHLLAKDVPVVSAFSKANIEAICDLKPDLVIGYSYIQDPIEEALKEKDLPTLISHHSNFRETKTYIERIGTLIDKENDAKKLNEELQEALNNIIPLTDGPRVYFEEWDDPRIPGALWIQELIQLCGGHSISQDRLSNHAMTRVLTDDQIIERNPELILASWCGKPVDISSIIARDGYDQVEAVKTGRISEVPGDIFLQLGPRFYLEGPARLLKEMNP